MNNLGNCWGMAFKFCSPLFLTWTSHLAPLRGSRGLQLLPHKSYVRNLHGASLMWSAHVTPESTAPTVTLQVQQQPKLETMTAGYIVHCSLRPWGRSVPLAG